MQSLFPRYNERNWIAGMSIKLPVIIKIDQAVTSMAPLKENL